MRACTMVLIASATLALAGCSHPSSTSAPTPSSGGPQAATAGTRLKTPWDSLLKDRDKAKAVQQTVNDYAKRQQQAIEKQSQ
ncbi:MAG TPA: hypothetical protein VFK31_05065 [Rhodanobacteraceae bacterium]|nr:hypothetical protein [Rhodanobacteraceae bacterium]